MSARTSTILESREDKNGVRSSNYNSLRPHRAGSERYQGGRTGGFVRSGRAWHRLLTLCREGRTDSQRRVVLSWCYSEMPDARALHGFQNVLTKDICCFIRGFWYSYLLHMGGKSRNFASLTCGRLFPGIIIGELTILWRVGVEQMRV